MARLDLTIWFMAGKSLHTFFNYNSDLFNRSTIETLTQQTGRMLQLMTENPEMKLSETAAILRREAEAQREREAQQRETSKLSKLKKGKRRRARARERELVRTSLLNGDNPLPLVLEPSQEVDLPSWLEDHRAKIEDQLAQHGAILFRGFGIDDVAIFEKTASRLCNQVYKENAEHTPISENGRGPDPGQVPGRPETAVAQ